MSSNPVMVLEVKLLLAAAAWERRTILYNFTLRIQHEETQDVIQANTFLILSNSVILTKLIFDLIY